MNLIKGALERPIAVISAVLMVIMFGIVALQTIPIQLTPDVRKPVLVVRTNWFGAAPAEIEREIVNRQEEAIRGLEGLDKMTSRSEDGRGTVTLEFNVGTNMDKSLLLLANRLDRVDGYPEEADEPTINTSGSEDNPIAWFILSRVDGNDRAMHTYGDFAEDVIRDRLERVPGVAGLNIYGGSERELRVIVDPERMAAYRLTVTEILSVLRAANAASTAGDVEEGKRRYVVRTEGDFEKPEDVQSVVLRTVSGQNGSGRVARVTVRDIAKVTYGYKEPTSRIRFQGKPAMAFNAVRETGANVIETMAGIREAIKDLNAGPLPRAGLKVVQVYDETVYINSAIDLVQQNIWVGGVLAALILMIFLRSWRPTLVVSLAIPVSVIGSFVAMAALGRSINVISLAGLAFAVGMVVDAAIVVLENIYRLKQEGHPTKHAAYEGARQVWGAILVSSLTTVMVFIPLLVMDLEVGQLFRDIAVAISVSVLLSLVVAVTLIPALSNWLLAGRDMGHVAPKESTSGAALRKAGAGLSAAASSAARRAGHGDRLDKAKARIGDAGAKAKSRFRNEHGQFYLPGIDEFGRGFHRFVMAMTAKVVVSRPLAIGVVAVVCGITSLLSWALLPKLEYLPEGNRNLVIGWLAPPPGYNLDTMSAMARKLEDKMRPHWASETGPKSKPGEPVKMARFFFVTFRGNTIIGAAAVDGSRAGELIPVIAKPALSLEPGTFGRVSQPSVFGRGIGGSRSINLDISGPDLEKNLEVALRAVVKVVTIFPREQGHQMRPRPGLELGAPELRVVPNRILLSDNNVTARELANTIDTFNDGLRIAEITVGGKRIDLMLMGPYKKVTKTQGIAALPVVTGDGRILTVGALAKVSVTSGPTEIRRIERARTITLEIFPAPEIPLEAALDTIKAEIIKPLEKDGLPEGVRINLSGTADELQKTWDAIVLDLLLALIIVYLVMAVLFESFKYPLIIMLSVPLATAGGVLGLGTLNIFTRQPLDMLTLLGFIILVGIVVNNAILLVHQTLANIREGGMEPTAAILESTRTRIRPIFMSTLTSIFGMLPLVVFPGAGSELYRGLGSVVVGGLTLSALLTLSIIPPLLSLLVHSEKKPEGTPAKDAPPAPVPAE